MKKIIIISLLATINFASFGQQVTSNWYFGTGVGLNFNQLPPSVITNNAANSQEGCASISDNNGSLLFYTNGNIIINRKHETMLNGNGISGDLSSSNNVLIVPLPNNDSIYYLFTIGAENQLNKGFRYSIVNIKGDGGFGEVIQKNIYIQDEVFEKLSAVRHCNNKDVWITIRKWETDEYHTYLVTSAGLSTTPIISKTGLTVGGFTKNAIGLLKFSTDGKRLAAVHSFQNDAVEIMSFDNTTGIISNPVVIYPNATPHPQSFLGVYAAEFSPNGNLLYVTANNSATEPCVLYQFDVTSNNAATITASKHIIAQTTPWYAGALQTGPDEKIYMAMWKDTAISVIENPNIYGIGCGFNFNKIIFSRRIDPIQFGLPSFIQSDLNPNFAPFNFTRLGNCTNNNVSFLINRTTGIDSVRWNFGDGQQSTTLLPTHSYATKGFFTVTLNVFTTDCSGQSNFVITKDIWLTDIVSNLLGNDTSSCIIQNLKLTPTLKLPGINYLWNTGSTNDTLTVNNAGKFWVQLQYQGCTFSDTINITLKPKPIISLGNDTTICPNNLITLSAANNSAYQYLWNTGETTSAITINKTGIYSVIATQNFCSSYDTIQIGDGDCEIFIPNAFSPNNDGINDYFKILGSILVKNFSLKIFNRYGQTIFNSQNVADKWDGKFKGKDMPTGAYPYTIKYINSKGYTKWLNGVVVIVH